jgi:hypothetical protein
MVAALLFDEQCFVAFFVVTSDFFPLIVLVTFFSDGFYDLGFCGAATPIPFDFFPYLIIFFMFKLLKS